MCTVIVALKQRPGCPLIVAANRDESRARPFTDLELWPGPVAFTAGRDALAGGTWMGLNERGLFVALTNLWTGAPPNPGRRSRGALVVSLLRCPDLATARALLESTDPADFNPCLLVAADVTGAGLRAQPGPGAFHVEPLAAGVHVVGNVLPGSPGDEKLARAAAGARSIDLANTSEEALVDALWATMGAHTGDRRPHESVCVHWDERNYGTVCASVLITGAQNHWYYKRSPPCVGTATAVEIDLSSAREAASRAGLSV